MAEVKVRWGVEDGYVGKDRPHEFTIDMDELLDSCGDEKELSEYLNAELQTAFESNITPYLKNEEEIIAAWKAAKAIVEGESP